MEGPSRDVIRKLDWWKRFPGMVPVQGTTGGYAVNLQTLSVAPAPTTAVAPATTVAVVTEPTEGTGGKKARTVPSPVRPPPTVIVSPEESKQEAITHIRKLEAKIANLRNTFENVQTMLIFRIHEQLPLDALQVLWWQHREGDPSSWRHLTAETFHLRNFLLRELHQRIWPQRHGRQEYDDRAFIPYGDYSNLTIDELEKKLQGLMAELKLHVAQLNTHIDVFNAKRDLKQREKPKDRLEVENLIDDIPTKEKVQREVDDTKSYAYSREKLLQDLLSFLGSHNAMVLLLTDLENQWREVPAKAKKDRRTIQDKWVRVRSFIDERETRIRNYVFLLHHFYQYKVDLTEYAYAPYGTQAGQDLPPWITEWDLRNSLKMHQGWLEESQRDLSQALVSPFPSDDELRDIYARDYGDPMTIEEMRLDRQAYLEWEKRQFQLAVDIWAAKVAKDQAKLNEWLKLKTGAAPAPEPAPAAQPKTPPAAPVIDLTFDPEEAADAFIAKYAGSYDQLLLRMNRVFGKGPNDPPGQRSQKLARVLRERLIAYFTQNTEDPSVDDIPLMVRTNENEWPANAWRQVLSGPEEPQAPEAPEEEITPPSPFKLPALLTPAQKKWNDFEQRLTILGISLRDELLKLFPKLATVPDPPDLVGNIRAAFLRYYPMQTERPYGILEKIAAEVVGSETSRVKLIDLLRTLMSRVAAVKPEDEPTGPSDAAIDFLRRNAMPKDELEKQKALNPNPKGGGFPVLPFSLWGGFDVEPVTKKSRPASKAVTPKKVYPKATPVVIDEPEEVEPEEPGEEEAEEELEEGGNKIQEGNWNLRLVINPGQVTKNLTAKVGTGVEDWDGKQAIGFVATRGGEKGKEFRTLLNISIPRRLGIDPRTIRLSVPYMFCKDWDEDILDHRGGSRGYLTALHLHLFEATVIHSNRGDQNIAFLPLEYKSANGIWMEFSEETDVHLLTTIQRESFPLVGTKSLPGHMEVVRLRSRAVPRYHIALVLYYSSTKAHNPEKDTPELVGFYIYTQ